jgi:hypothetical protein
MWDYCRKEMEEDKLVDFSLNLLEDLCGNYIFPSQEVKGIWNLKRKEFYEECSKLLGCQKEIQGINPRTSRDLGEILFSKKINFEENPRKTHPKVNDLTRCERERPSWYRSEYGKRNQIREDLRDQG